MRKLTELEGVALGVVHKRQPCTAYTIRMELQDSPSSHWRASAGSIYPLISRLENDRLLRSTLDADDARGRRLLRLTAPGRKSLKAWIRGVSDSELVAEVFDPIRTRVHFLAALSHAEQLRFAEATLDALTLHLGIAESHLGEKRNTADLFEQLGATGGVMNAENRIEFLQMVLARIRDRD